MTTTPTGPHGRSSHDWPRRVAVEIVEHQWNHGILITRVPVWDTNGIVGHNQEDVPREVWDQPVGTIVHAVLARHDSVDDDDFAYAMPEFRDWEWPGGAETAPVDTIVVPREDLRALFDLAVNSLNFGSGFWDTDDTNAARRIAVALGVDPMEATPSEFRRQYKHTFDPYVHPRAGATDTCRWCSSMAAAKVHQDVEAGRG